MDQLELLKKDWKKQEHSLPRLSQSDFSKLIHKRSSSIVKWIFIISVLEFVLPYLILLVTGYEETSMKKYEELGLTNFMTVFFAITNLVILYFIYRFYKNYKSISANSNPKTLMQNIIRTRRIVKYYIWFNLIMAAFIAIVVLYKTFVSDEFIEKLPSDANMIVVWLISLLLITIVLALFYLFYRLLYGILLNKLKKNYNELINNGNGNS